MEGWWRGWSKGVEGWWRGGVRVWRGWSKGVEGWWRGWSRRFGRDMD